MIRRLPLPTRMHLRRSAASRGGRSARALLLASWRRAFGVAAVLACAASASEVLDPHLTPYRYEHRIEHGLAGAVIGFAAAKIERAIAPDWTRAHPVLARLIAEAPVVGAAIGKEAIDRHRGGEQLHHSEMDVAVTSLGGVVGVELAWRF